jgi:hypothetical protein
MVEHISKISRTIKNFPMKGEIIFIVKSLVKSSIHHVAGDIWGAELRMRMGVFNKNSYYDFLSYLIMQRVENSRGSVWIDIGSHEGEILKEMLATAPEAEFLAFEPIPKYYQILKDRFPHTMCTC